MTAKEFINQVFLNEYAMIFDSGFHYISFALIGLGIEFLGACLDANEFDDRRHSKARFTNAVRQLFPLPYHRFSAALYTDLRCGFAHQFRPGSEFVVTHRTESRREGTNHLGPFRKQTVIVAEVLYEDFRSACVQVNSRIDAGVLTHPKLMRAFLKVT